MNNLDKSSIVYKIENRLNNKCYIGQSSQSFNKRYRNNLKVNAPKLLKEDIEKYGIENFSIEILYHSIKTKEERLELEDKMIQKYKSLKTQNGYNIAQGGNKNPLLGKTEEELNSMKKILSQLNSGKNNPMYGKNAYANKTEEEMKEISYKKSIALKGRKLDKETKEKISKTKQQRKHTYKSNKSGNNPRAIKIKVYYQNNLFGTYDCVNDAVKDIEQWFLENKNIKCKLKDGIHALRNGYQPTKRSKLYGWSVI